MDIPRIKTATERIRKRAQQDIGLGGKMSNNPRKWERIREIFLSLPEILGPRLPIMILPNNDDISPDNTGAIEEINKKILAHLKK